MVDTPRDDPEAPAGDPGEVEETMADDESGERELPREHRAGWNTKIDEMIPLPQDEPYHNDDAVAEDPYDAQDQVDRHVPPATGVASELVDDFSTREELGVDNAPGGQNPEHARAHELTGEIEDATFRDDAVVEGEVIAGGPATTTCPACGQRTDALRFCGHCGASLVESRREITGDTQVERLLSRAAGVLEPFAAWTRPGAVRGILAAGALLALIALLANSGALALVIGATILPAIILYWCRRGDVFENEPLYIIAGFVIAGIVLGALLGWLSAFTVANSWFDEGVLNFGAAGFGGHFAEAAGNPSLMVWLVSGLLVPALAIAAIIASPLLSRQLASLGNEVMDGLTMAAALGGGFAIGTALVFVSPMFGQAGPAIDAAGWTLTTIGLTVIRPLTWTLAGGMIGAGAWRYLVSGNLRPALVPAVAGIAAPLVASLLALQLSTVGLWAEVAMGAVIAIAVAVLYQRTLADAIREDRRVLGGDEARVVCPHCHRVTPAGAFCAYCGEPLAEAAEVA